jgi:hypothetical protein
MLAVELLVEMAKLAIGCRQGTFEAGDLRVPIAAQDPTLRDHHPNLEQVCRTDGDPARRRLSAHTNHCA